MVMRNRRLVVFIASYLALSTGAADAQSARAVDRPHFTGEPVAAFRTAFTGRTSRGLDQAHSDETRYHAFSFMQRGAVTVGIAKSISVDSSGRVHIVGEHGTVTYGRASNGSEYSHVLVPIGVTPP